mmetsp:Transcript_5471/g.6020  ORF Transcript_5471/g.6020 Transcript_5471/m.6020 type:complete len:1426 (+) Transcript_5471:82-4359(+)|eukprot:CAMPEP_0194138618 /NCGR_PEP_ID=MMETSP0152-20130528/8369_1 /TAXON_ID=1049557 /ORGANISM="Thalassiothrix antarctica, Strain L6-D1" /LENGTH=1425 /DNA_ID=CAMNT_0038836115 /DNA_START=82 /DNA_END=4359 /DNA_ORIENTATION=-
MCVKSEDVSSLNKKEKSSEDVNTDSTTGRTGRDLGVWESSLEDRAGIISTWMLSYISPLLKLGAEKVLDSEDIGVPSKGDRADYAYETSLAAWKEEEEKCRIANLKEQKCFEGKLEACSSEEEKKKIKKPKLKEPSLGIALMNAFGGFRFFLAIIYYVISALLSFVPVLVLNDLVKFFESPDRTLSDPGTFVNPWIEVAGLAIVPLMVSVLQTRSQVIMSHSAVFVRTAVSTLMYRKSLRISSAARAKTSTGQIVNMMSNDAAQLQSFLKFGGMTAVAPLQIIISLFLIYQQVGNATWVGVGFMVILAPINVVIFSVVSKMRRKVLKYSDLRVKMVNEILNGIRVIKFYAWEKPFGKEVGKIRGAEMKALTQLAYVSAVGFSLILLSAPILQPIMVFAVYVNVQNKSLDAATAFTTVALFNIMRFPFAFLPMGLLQYIQSMISIGRLERFLVLPELSEYVSDGSAKDDDKEYETSSITINDGSFSWIDPDAPEIRPIQDEPKKKKKPKRRSRSRNSEEEKSDDESSSALQSSHHSAGSITQQSIISSMDEEKKQKASPITLRDISCVIESGSLVAVVGAVGSGKSSLLSTILGEMEPINGSKVHIPTGGADKAGFISYAAQTAWVVNDTLRGNVIFGREFDQERYDRVLESCALLDDLVVLPAGDLTEIGERGINLSGGQKARVSLARALYSAETKILLMDDPLSAVDAHVGEHLFANAITGEISEGITRVLVTHHVHLLSRCDKVIMMKRGRIEHQGKYEDLVSQGVDFAGAVDVSKVQTTDDVDDKTGKEEPQKEKEVKELTLAEEKKKAQEKEQGKKLVKDEERNVGDISGSAYLHYARVGGWFFAFASVFIQGVGRGTEILASFWLSYWAAQTFTAISKEEPLTGGQTNYYIGIYALFGLFSVLGLTLRSIFMAVHRLNASKKMHEDLTNRILRAPVAFFDVTPIGRVLNRFAADMDKIDLQLTQSLGQGVSTVFNVLGAFGAIIAATKGTFMIPMIPLGYLYYLIQKWFRKTSTELQRVTSVANSPIFADFSQTLSGTSTIRAYGAESRFFNHCQQSFDNMNASYMLVDLTNSWLGVRLDILGGLIGAFIGGLAVATQSIGFIPAGWLGLALSYAIEVTQFLKHGVRMIATVEADMNSVERVLHYSSNIDQEPPAQIEGKDPQKGKWPANGKIEMKNISMRYRNGPLVLKNLSLTVKGGEKIGVVGRTGSGKSSLMVVLFRISEIEQDGGEILIDDVNVGKIGTTALRLNLSIIPQDPVMFSNTVRYNLDPFGETSDDELWEVLQKVELAEVIALLPNGLNEEVAEGGENFSQGQRQLLCIARSLLRNPKILIMDEATASIDNKTDAAIQTMIRENFSNATVMTIAHRLNTIMDSDRVLVLDDGGIAEFDTPSNLLSNKSGLFRAMVDKNKAAAHGNADE